MSVADWSDSVDGEKPICPFCGAVDDDPLVAVPRDEVVQSSCLSCGQDFLLRVSITVCCSTIKAAEPAPQEPAE